MTHRKPPEADLPEEIRWQGNWIVAKQRGKWEYAGRSRGIRAAAILAIEDGHVLLVEQYRVPLGRRCIEIPAGLVGDSADTSDESAISAARRELEEETGYRAAKITDLGEFFSSPGMVSEGFSLLRAEGLTKVSEGGGTDGEDITVHRVALRDLTAFVEAKRAEGLAVDVRIAMLLMTQRIGENGWLDG
tara:strand:- start:202 stop:768 length:567 start_codon:yes stop_codon:yes gene_type:complete